MSTGAWIFMIASWTFVLGLMFWSFRLVLQKQKHHDPDGIGPASPPEPARADPSSGPPAGGDGPRIIT